MAEITAQLVKELREATNVGMMDCKRALAETNGDKDAAIKLLRERGIAVAGKRAARAAKEGIVASALINDGKSGVMIEVNCETDFVSRNENFQAFVKDMLEKAKTVKGDLAEAVKDDVAVKIAEIGENIIVRRNVRFDLQGTGIIGTYIHMGGKVGVLLEMGFEKAETANNPVCAETVKDITLHIAASAPQYLNSSEIPADVIASERAIFAKQVENKPPQIIEKIVDGKIAKFYSTVCLVDQPFVKDGDFTVTKWLEKQSKEIGDTLAIRRFALYKLGE